MASDPRASQQPFPGDQQQPAPGLTSKMAPTPDHGEDSYVGKGLLAGRMALITGGDSGIGRAVAIAFAREGADVTISYLAVEQSDAEDTARWIERAGRRAILLPGDIQERRIATPWSSRPWCSLANSTSWSTTPPTRR